ncbi:hypothetical protein J2S17_001725 [Cytobacillus purgationiresistens]|uniref:NERD domain-containing protein n=2 Tax=Cytobacillus purgationiresistens TaxID=863449 RepID=A0ABU0AHE5_9BACI|nr:hypothetical protein [Cytobacillus purgationiresistens]
MHHLNQRKALNAKDQHYYFNLEKGYLGEQIFKQHMHRLMNKAIILDDLLLEINQTTFQIDLVCILQHKIYLFEVKNYEGDFYVDKNVWYMIAGKEIKNPLMQLNRSESLFRQLLAEYKINIPIESFLIFVNPEFTLLQAPLNANIILPTQLPRFIKHLHNQPSLLNSMHQNLSKQLTSVKLIKSPFSRIPVYEYENIEKGVICQHCKSFMEVDSGKLHCLKCKSNEEFEKAVLRNVDEMTLLFPDMKITTNAVYEWCKGLIQKRKIQSILSNHLKSIGHGKGRYYS